MAITLLTPPHNFAICKLEGRTYPGVVFQGDSLFALYNLLRKTHDELQLNSKGQKDPDSAIYDLEYELEKLSSILESYEQICKKGGYGLPYVKSDIKDNE